MSFSQRKSQPFSQINMVPYLDVMLVLLIIFMMVVPAVQSGVQVNLPVSKAAPLVSAKTSVPITLWLDAKGQRWLSQGESQAQAVTEDAALASWLKSHAGSEPPTLYIKADKALLWERVVQSMALVRRLGWSKMVLITESATQAASSKGS